MKRLKFLIIAALAAATYSTEVQAGPVTSNGGYEYDRSQLSDATTFNWAIESCRHGAITPAVQQQLARLLNVPEDNVRFEYCRRILGAYVKGTIPYGDYVQLAQNHVMAPSILRALRISPSAMPKSSLQHPGKIVLPVSATMSSGEKFKGTTVASQGHGHFSVRSSRKAVTCSGDYDLRDRRPTVTLPVACTDGRTGELIVTRAVDMMSAVGKATLSDGSSGRLTVGKAKSKP